MAQRRMFSLKIVDTDDFLDMPESTRLLYFDLGMRADDDGFIQPKKVMRLTGSNDDDLKLLLAKNFIIPFNNRGVIVITDWRENNYIQKDRYTPTKYIDEAKKLSCIQNVYKLDTQVRIGKDRLGKVREEINRELTTQQLQDLKIKFPNIDVYEEYDKCKDYIASTGKTYKDYLAMFRNWLRRIDIKKEPEIIITRRK